MRRTPPAHIVQELKRYDPMLRIRWSMEKKCFILERQAFRKLQARCLGPGKDIKREDVFGLPVEWSESVFGMWRSQIAPEMSERYIAFHEGYVPVLETKEIDRRVLRAVFSMDAWKFGRYGKQFKNESEYREKKMREAEKKRRMDETRSRSAAVYEHMGYWDGRRMSMVA